MLEVWEEPAIIRAEGWHNNAAKPHSTVARL